jgi:hypothetical protein
VRPGCSRPPWNQLDHHPPPGDSQIFDRATPQQRIADLRIFRPEVGYLTQINACGFTWRHSENGYGFHDSRVEVRELFVRGRCNDNVWSWRPVLTVRTEGPFLLVRLPAEHYQIGAQTRHITETGKSRCPRVAGLNCVSTGKIQIVTATRTSVKAVRLRAVRERPVLLAIRVTDRHKNADQSR